MTEPSHCPFRRRITTVAERGERRWASVSVAIVVLLVVMATFTGFASGRHAAARASRPSTRDVARRGEFIESNLGSALEPDGSVTVRGSASNTPSRRNACSCRPARR